MKGSFGLRQRTGRWRVRAGVCLLPPLLSVVGGCCVFTRSPPASPFPNADAALERMHETYACSRGVQGEARIDYYGDRGRVSGNLLYLASVPERVRFDIYSPFGVMLSTLTSNGQDFALFNLDQKEYLHGPASACNVARFTQVPVPPHALVQILRGEAPVLVHESSQARLEWDCGHYVVTIASRHSARQEILLEPTPATWDKPWTEQLVRVIETTVAQHDVDLYRAEFTDHEVARRAAPRRDPDGLDADIPPSGPECRAEVPRAIRLVVPDTDDDVLVVSKEVTHNPPLIERVFEQRPPGGVTVRYAACTN